MAADPAYNQREHDDADLLWRQGRSRGVPQVLQAAKAVDSDDGRLPGECPGTSG